MYTEIRKCPKWERGNLFNLISVTVNFMCVRVLISFFFLQITKCVHLMKITSFFFNLFIQTITEFLFVLFTHFCFLSLQKK